MSEEQYHFWYPVLRALQLAQDDLERYGVRAEDRVREVIVTLNFVVKSRYSTDTQTEIMHEIARVYELFIQWKILTREQVNAFFASITTGSPYDMIYDFSLHRNHQTPNLLPEYAIDRVSVEHKTDYEVLSPVCAQLLAHVDTEPSRWTGPGAYNALSMLLRCMKTFLAVWSSERSKGYPMMSNDARVARLVELEFLSPAEAFLLSPLYEYSFLSSTTQVSDAGYVDSTLIHELWSRVRSNHGRALILRTLLGIARTDRRFDVTGIDMDEVDELMRSGADDLPRSIVSSLIYNPDLINNERRSGIWIGVHHNSSVIGSIPWKTPQKGTAR